MPTVRESFNEASHSENGVERPLTPTNQTFSFGQPTSRAGQVFGSGGPRAFQLGGRFQF